MWISAAKRPAHDQAVGQVHAADIPNPAASTTAARGREYFLNAATAAAVLRVAGTASRAAQLSARPELKINRR